MTVSALSLLKKVKEVLAFLLKDEVASGKVKFKEIDGLTIENRAACNKAIPDDVLPEKLELPCYS